MILHKVSSSPFEYQALRQCLSRAKVTDKVLLAQDAVYSLLKQDEHKTLQPYAPIYVLEDDIKARGLQLDNTLFKALSYPEFVELSLDCDQVISWS